MSNKAQIDRMNALMGGKDRSSGAADGGVSRDEFERTSHELDVSRGRVKALDARVKELEKENAALRASRSQDEIVTTALTDEERESLDPKFLNAMAKMSAASEERLRREREEREAARRAQDEQEREAQLQEANDRFAAEIEAKFPGFIDMIVDGGERAAEWTDFCKTYGPSVNAAYSRFDVKGVAHFIKMFYAERGIRVPSGSQGKATSPDPRNLGSGATVQQPDEPNKTYSAEEYAALEKKAMAARRRGDWKEYGKLNDELNNILAEGRVKD